MEMSGSYTGIVFDLILVILIVLMIRRGWKRGMLAVLIMLLGWCVALFILPDYTGAWADKLYDSVVEPWAVKKVAQAIPEEYRDTFRMAPDTTAYLAPMLEELDGPVASLVSSAGITPDALKSAPSSGGETLEESLVVLLRPILLPLTRALVTLAAVAVVTALFGMMAKKSSRRFGDSALRAGSRLFGAVLGAAEGVALGSVYALVLTILAQTFPIPWLTPELLGKTLLVSRLAGFLVP